MSRSAIQRRRRKGKRATAMAGDAMDLFLDAMTNTLGVVMFILLMVVLFGRPERTVQVQDQSVVREIKSLREDRDALAAQAAALPPPGDPELAARWKAALEAIAQVNPTLDRVQQAILQRTAQLATERAKADAAREAKDAMTELVLALEKKASAPTTNMVRVSRFHEDTRKPVLLAASNGRVSRLAITSQTTEIAAPQAGQALGDEASVHADARAVLQVLLAGSSPATHRVELVVWADSFAEAKVLEEALLEMGYDTNPLPVAAGGTLKSGTGGVQ